MLSEARDLRHQEFLDLSGDDPSRRFSEALVDACREQGPVFVYSAKFEKGRIKELAERFPDLSIRLLAISNRMVDLLNIATERYYHPSQQGSWSIKKVLPAIAADLDYGQLEGVQNGEMAMTAFKEGVVSRNPRKFRRPPRRSTGKLFDALGQTPERFVHIFQSLGFYALRA